MIDLERYREALKKHGEKQGLMMNPDGEVVTPLLEGLLVNGDRYGIRTCPCRPAVGVREKDLDIVCPCVYALPDVEDHGSCYCELFVSEGWAQGTTPRKIVPERRPREKILGL